MIFLSQTERRMSDVRKRAPLHIGAIGVSAANASNQIPPIRPNLLPHLPTVPHHTGSRIPALLRPVRPVPQLGSVPRITTKIPSLAEVREGIFLLWDRDIATVVRLLSVDLGYIHVMAFMVPILSRIIKIRDIFNASEYVCHDIIF